MKTSIQLYFENNALIVSSALLKLKTMDWLVYYIVRKLKFSHWISFPKNYGDYICVKEWNNKIKQYIYIYKF
jgi:hypothetical protein